MHNSQLSTKARSLVNLLSVDHPAGRAKAAFFLCFGFSTDRWEELRDALLAHAASARLVSVEHTAFGMKYILEGPLRSPTGRQPQLRAVWFVEAGEQVPRLVTAYPVPGSER